MCAMLTGACLSPVPERHLKLIFLCFLVPQACVDCVSNLASKVAPLYDVEIPDMDLNGILEPMEEGNGGQSCLPLLPPDMAMEEEAAAAEASLAAEEQMPQGVAEGSG